VLTHSNAKQGKKRKEKKNLYRFFVAIFRRELFDTEIVVPRRRRRLYRELIIGSRRNHGKASS
jgi:hypothetical protein